MRLLLAVAILATAGCSSTEVKGTYRPAFLPVRLEWGPAGLKIAGEASLVTPVGVFSIGADYQLPDDGDDGIYVIVRNANEVPPGQSDVGFDHIYKLRSGSGEFTAVVNGTTTIQVVDRQVLIDVTEGDVRSIQFKQAEIAVQEHRPGFGERWQTYWDTSFYSPFSLSRWAYDDSTMSKWMGFGFLWFLVRLVVALILGVVDLLLTVACFLAAVAFVLFGPTGQNIVYGVEAILGIMFSLGFLSFWLDP
ncbi:hypothetical protein [Nonomuraea sp. NPDC046570]|uniref:hypothetical protein n=1 Tax=Nonomuraea sp. NPDC046570 TaxID=3155255 RepID=UPI0033E6BD2B